MPREVKLRPAARPADDGFLMSVFASTRAAELAVLGWPPERLEGLIRMQFDAQSRGYAQSFPEAESSVVEVDGRPAGRLIVDRSDRELRIVDLALLPEFRRAGVGTVLVRGLLDEADAGSVPVRCHVAEGNDARLFWEQLGLRAGSSDGAYLAMERPCST